MNRERENAKVELNGSAESRAIARMLAQQRTAPPKLSQYDEDARLIYGEMSGSGFGLPCGCTLTPGSWDIRNTAVYARGKEVSEMLRGPIIPAHLNEHHKRFTRASRQFEICFGREPVAGDVLHFHQVALVEHPDLTEITTNWFIQAWDRRLAELPCPVKFENGRLFKRVIQGRPGSIPQWVEDISVQPQAIWLEIEKDIKWRELGMPLHQSAEALGLSLEAVPTIPAITFLGVEPETNPHSGMTENKHRYRAATEEEIERPEIEPPKGSVLAVLKLRIFAREGRCKNPLQTPDASR
jgi:hypothetical protein